MERTKEESSHLAFPTFSQSFPMSHQAGIYHLSCQLHLTPPPTAWQPKPLTWTVPWQFAHKQNMKRVGHSTEILFPLPTVWLQIVVNQEVNRNLQKLKVLASSLDREGWPGDQSIQLSTFLCALSCKCPLHHNIRNEIWKGPAKTVSFSSA